MSLKELTMDQHRNAERQKFASILMSGSIPETSYLRFLINQFHCYHALENHHYFSLFDNDLKRCSNILADIQQLKLKLDWKIDDNIVLTKSTLEYVEHVNNHIKSKDDFIAHIYVRYLGDMRGGQIISKKIPGNGKYYDFNNPQKLASSIYQLLNDEMADEAKKVFNFATLLFQEMHEIMLLNNEL